MPVGTPQPLTEDVQIFNEICTLADDAVYSPAPQPRLRQLAWRLKGLARQQPDNLVIKAAFGRALVMTGQREQSLPELEAAYRLRSPHFVEIQGALMHSFATIGDFQKALTLARELISASVVCYRQAAITHSSLTAFLAGDANYLLELEDLARSTDITNTANLIISSFGRYLLPHLAKHLEIVHSFLQPLACNYNAEFVDDGHEPMLMGVNYGIHCSKIERRVLERKLFRALYDYYAKETDIPPGIGAGACGFDLFALAEAPELEAEAVA